MHIWTGLTASLLGAALTLSYPVTGSAQADQTWQTCIGMASTPDDRVPACSAVIDARAETGRRLAAAYCNRGHGLTEKRELDRALADLDEAVRLDPAYVCAYTNRGNAWRDSEQLERAAADYAEVIRLAPTDARGWRNRGMIRLYKGDNKGGLADYDKALQYDPADVFSWNNRGQARLRLGDRAGAIADFRKALELRPDLATARASLQQLGVTP